MAVALKEWSVVCDALLAGEQFVTLRKGGIEEEAGEFKPLHLLFYLFPTQEHQKAETLREPWRSRFKKESPPISSLTLTGYARTVKTRRVATESEAVKLSALTIWSPDTLRQRFHLYPHKPLVLMALRVYRLKNPVTLPIDASYAGCRSWVPLVGAPALPVPEATPVLSEEGAAVQWARVERALLHQD